MEEIAREEQTNISQSSSSSSSSFSSSSSSESSDLVSQPLFDEDAMLREQARKRAEEYIFKIEIDKGWEFIYIYYF